MWSSPNYLGHLFVCVKETELIGEFAGEADSEYSAHAAASAVSEETVTVASSSFGDSDKQKRPKKKRKRYLNVTATEVQNVRVFCVSKMLALDRLHLGLHF